MSPDRYARSACDHFSLKCLHFQSVHPPPGNNRPLQDPEKRGAVPPQAVYDSFRNEPVYMRCDPALSKNPYKRIDHRLLPVVPFYDIPESLPQSAPPESHIHTSDITDSARSRALRFLPDAELSAHRPAPDCFSKSG